MINLSAYTFAQEAAEEAQQCPCVNAETTTKTQCNPCLTKALNLGCKKPCNGKNDEQEKNCLIECDDVYCRRLPLSLSHTEGHWFDNRIGYTSMRWFWPHPAIPDGNYFPFIDIRGHVFNNGTAAGNFGGGVRMINGCNQSTIYGVNAFYDFRKAAWNHYFQQIGIGFEILNPCLDIRFNGYIPLCRQTVCSKMHRFESEHEKTFSWKKRRVLTGFDASIGKWIVKDARGRFDYYATLGIYTYFPQKRQKNIFGGEVRLIANLIQFLSLELRGGYDSYYGTLAQGTLGVYIPLGVSPCDCYTNSYLNDNCYLRERLCQSLLRQEIIALDKKEHHHFIHHRGR
jgi:Inverse autotransporter, beta-domain